MRLRKGTAFLLLAAVLCFGARVFMAAGVRAQDLQGDDTLFPADDDFPPAFDTGNDSAPEEEDMLGNEPQFEGESFPQDDASGLLPITESLPPSDVSSSAGNQTGASSAAGKADVNKGWYGQMEKKGWFGQVEKKK